MRSASVISAGPLQHQSIIFVMYIQHPFKNQLATARNSFRTHAETIQRSLRIHSQVIRNFLSIDPELTRSSCKVHAVPCRTRHPHRKPITTPSQSIRQLSQISIRTHADLIRNSRGSFTNYLELLSKPCRFLLRHVSSKGGSWPTAWIRLKSHQGPSFSLRNSLC